jgi:hypothetical protein
MKVVDEGVLGNSHNKSFEKKSRQHVGIVPIVDIFVRLWPTNKSPNLTSNFDPWCKSKSSCI